MAKKKNEQTNQKWEYLKFSQRKLHAKQHKILLPVLGPLETIPQGLQKERKK